MTVAPSRIAELVETFGRNLDTYEKQPYDETQVRKEFIDPFFKALGWDVASEKGCAPAKIPTEKNQIQRQIASTDKQIDDLVYKLYSLTEEEIRIIEESPRG